MYCTVLYEPTGTVVNSEEEALPTGTGKYFIRHMGILFRIQLVD
jgi:hypothetical protein